MRISDWSSDVCSSDLVVGLHYHIEFVARGSRVDLQPGAGRNIGVAQHLPGRWRQSGGQEHDVKVRIKLPQLGDERRQPLEIGTETASPAFDNMGLVDNERTQVRLKACVFGARWRRRFEQYVARRSKGDFRRE